MSIDSLCSDIRRGNRGAARRLCRAIGPLMLAEARASLGHDAEVEGVVHDALSALLGEIVQGDAICPVRRARQLVGERCGRRQRIAVRCNAMRE